MMRALALVTALALTACAGPQILAPGPGPVSPALDARTFTASDGFRLRYSVWQAPEPKAVILALHGMNDYGEAFSEAGAHWAANGITVYAYDQRGFGRTLGDGVWPGAEAMIRDLREAAAMLRSRHSGVPLFILGESMGAAVALSALGSSSPPEADGLVLVAPALRGWSDLDVLEKLSLWSLAQITPGSRLSGRGLGIQSTDNKDRLNAMAADPYVLKRTRIDALYGLVSLMERAQADAINVQTPALIVYGTKDQVAPQEPMRNLAARMKGRTKLQAFSDGYHMLLRDKGAARVLETIQAYVLRANTTK